MRAPSIYFRRIDDYIQGAPFDDTPGIIDSPVEMVAGMNGDATPLIWSNVDADIYGFDIDAGLKLTDIWRLDGTLSWTRGERRDVSDNLYRIAPPNLSLTLTRDEGPLAASIETVVYAEQSDVSAINGELETPGYALVNLFGEWRAADGVSLSLGVENLLDHSWRDHLGGYNRVMNSDIAVGQRLPGVGRQCLHPPAHAQLDILSSSDSQPSN